MRFFWGTLFLLLATLSFSQTPAYLHYTAQDGLPSNLVYCGLQDKRGLLWFATDKGLACFDGARFRVYGVADGLPDPEVLTMAEDSQGRLWLFCFRKKPCYMLDGRIVTEKEDPLLSKLDFNSGTYVMSEGGNGRLWFTGHTQFVYKLEGNQIESITLDDGAYVRVCEQMGATLALSTTQISRVGPNGDHERLIRIKHNAHTEPFINTVVSGNRLMYAFRNVAILFGWKNGRLEELDRREVFQGTVAIDRKGRFWHCSSAGGAVCFKDFDRLTTDGEVFLPDKKITYMFEDRQGTLWFCIYNDGLYALPENAPVKYFAENNELSRNIRTLARLPNGSIAAGNDIGQIHILQNNRVKTVDFEPNHVVNQVRQIVPSGSSELYIGTDLGLFIYQLESGKKIDLPKFRYSIKGLLVQGDTLWAATHGTFQSQDLNTGGFQHWLHVRTTAAGADADGVVWAGSINGLFSKADHFSKNWGDEFPELKSRIVAIKNGGPGQLWVVTPDKGLIDVRVQGGQVRAATRFPIPGGAPIENIQSLFVSPEGNLWMATNQGVFGVLRRENRLVHFSTYDGLADNDVNAVLVHGDTLWAGTANGLSRILLQSHADTIPFQSFLVNLRFQQKNKQLEYRLLDSLPQNHRLVLPADVANISMDLTGLDFRSRGNLSFELIRTVTLPPIAYWTLPNLIAWTSSRFSGKRDTSIVNASTYNLGSYLPPGKYIFDLTAVKPSGAHSTQPDRWTLIKKPYWYETIWFYLALWLLAVYLAWRVYRARAAYREVNANAAALQLQALQSQMNPHFIGNAVNAIQQFLHPPDPEKSSEYISMFMGLLRRTMHFSEQTFIPFEEELKYDQDYLTLVALRFEDRFEYAIDGAETIPPKTPIPTMLLQPLLENATMHGIAPSGISQLRLHFQLDGDYFCCTLTDNGLGYQETQRRKRLAGVERESKGLAILQKKIKALNLLYHLDLQLHLYDRAETEPSESGARVQLKYSLSKIWKAQEKQIQTAPTQNPSLP